MNIALLDRLLDEKRHEAEAARQLSDADDIRRLQIDILELRDDEDNEP